MKAQDYMNIIEYTHHLHPTTWGRCSNGCGKDARGSGLCVQCARDGLSEFIGAMDAGDFVSYVRDLHKFKCKIQKKLEMRENESILG